MYLVLDSAGWTRRGLRARWKFFLRKVKKKQINILKVIEFINRIKIFNSNKIYTSTLKASLIINKIN